MKNNLVNQTSILVSTNNLSNETDFILPEEFLND